MQANPVNFIGLLVSLVSLISLVSLVSLISLVSLVSLVSFYFTRLHLEQIRKRLGTPNIVVENLLNV
jgi:hypothetical protein